MRFAAISRWFFVVAAAVVVAAPAVALADAPAAVMTDAPAVALADKEKQAIADRIKPVGVVCLDDGTNCPVVSAPVSAPVASAEAAPASASVASAPAAAGGKSGEEIFKTTCSVCHAAGVAGAPKVGDKGVWAPRIAKGKDTLYKSALSGFNAMPPKGMCAACSDSEIRATVDYMVSQSK